MRVRLQLPIWCGLALALSFTANGCLNSSRSFKHPDLDYSVFAGVGWHTFRQSYSTFVKALTLWAGQVNARNLL